MDEEEPEENLQQILSRLAEIESLLPLAIELSSKEGGPPADQLNQLLLGFLTDDRALERLEDLLSREDLPAEIRAKHLETLRIWRRKALENGS